MTIPVLLFRAVAVEGDQQAFSNLSRDVQVNHEQHHAVEIQGLALKRQSEGLGLCEEGEDIE